MYYFVVSFLVILRTPASWHQIRKNNRWKTKNSLGL